MRVTTIFDSLPGRPTRVSVRADLNGRQILRIDDLEQEVLEALLEHLDETARCLERIGPEPSVTSGVIAAESAPLHSGMEQ